MNRTSLLAVIGVAILAAGVVVGFGLRGSARDLPPATGESALAAFSAYQQGGPPELLDDAEELAARALEDDPEDILAAEAATRVALSRHEFGDALDLAGRAGEIAPDRFAPVGLRADALIELGRYDEAFSAIDERLSLRPDLASYQRASYSSELRGELDASRRLMEFAAEAGTPGSFGRVASQIQLIQLELRYGRPDAAEQVIEQAAAENPDSAAEWDINRGRLAAAGGDLEGALATYRGAIEDIPDADHLFELAEIEAALGNDDEAAGYYARARDDLDAAAEIEDNALERAVLNADWNVPDADDVTEAREARERRPSVVGDSALAWVLARAGQCDEAVEFGRDSIRLGYLDPLFRFRAAYAESCAGNSEAARDIARELLDLTPNFSPRWAPAARAMAAGETPTLPADVS